MINIRYIDYRSPRGLDKPLILQLDSGQWLRDGLNLIIGGPKTWLACAHAHKACRDGYSVRYLLLPRLIEELGLAHGDGRFVKLMAGGTCLSCWTTITVTARRCGQMARADRRSDLGRCDPRQVGVQRLSDRTEGRIDVQACNEIDDGRGF